MRLSGVHLWTIPCPPYSHSIHPQTRAEHYLGSEVKEKVQFPHITIRIPYF